jgi:hypothetical protein
MRRQNPPQASLDQALYLEKYLHPAAIAAIYALCATVSFGFIALLYAVLVHDYILNPTSASITFFSMAGSVPLALAFLVYSRRPDDPLSRFIRRLAESRQCAISVIDDPRTFKVLLMNGDAVCINFSFYYPEKNHTPEVGERLIMYVHTALEQDCSMRDKLPNEREIEDAIDCALELLAAQFDIPVLYTEIRDIHKIRDSYSYTTADDLAPSEYLGTGTRG